MKNCVFRKVYLLGIGGIGMGGVALALKEHGFEVSGADRASVYDPMRTCLEASGISFAKGWDVTHIQSFRPDLVIIGNVCCSDNPLVRWVLDEGVAYEHLAGFVAKWFVGQNPKHQVVVAGTHGKTTTAMLIRDICVSAGRQTGSFVGGINRRGQLGVMFAKDPEIVVIEGDEYDCAFFDKQPKLSYYGVDIGVLNACEHDHVDIYPTSKDMIDAYGLWLGKFSSGGQLWVNQTVLQSASWETYLRHAVARGTQCHGFGRRGGSNPELAVSYRCEVPGQIAVFAQDERLWDGLSVAIPNDGFYQSVCVAVGVCRQLGLSDAEIRSGILAFSGVARRHNVLRSQGVVVIDDFAHHPSAVQMNLEGLRAQFPGRRLCVVFEPKSASSRRNIFYHQWKSVFRLADRVLFAPVFGGSGLKDPDQLDLLGLCADITDEGRTCVVAKNKEQLKQIVADDVRPDDVWVLFSNGSLSGVAQTLLAAPVH